VSVRFDGRVAVVTGAARGIGLAVAERLAAEGARVVLVDLLEEEGQSAVDRLRADGYEVVFERLDITDRGAVDAMVDRVVTDFGGIDVLVNNAALVQATPFFEATQEQFTKILGVNVVGTFGISQAVAVRMIESGRGGSVVNMSSITAAHGAPALMAYSSSKGALSAMTRSMAMALAEYGIRVNAVAPGAIGTENFREFWDVDPVMRQQVMSRTPLRRLGEPSEVASTVAFLASDDGGYFTGQVLYPDGGRLALSYTVPVDEP
jgi:NAD(P)-dependent dehydrogenase (short-subunit alcohol dehydrogenase family)